MISSKIRPQDPGGGGAAWIAAPQGVVDMEVTSSSMSSVVEPQSVPSRISVVLVEEAKDMGTEYLVPQRVDMDPRLLAGVASPASVTVNKGGKMSPGVVETLSPHNSDSVGPVGPYGTLSPSDCVGPYGTLSPSDSVGPYGTLSPSDSVGPYGMLSPSESVGPYGTLSPSDSVAVGPVGPDGTLSSSDLAGILFQAVPTGIPFQVGPVGPYGTLSLSDSVGPYGMLSPSESVGSYGTLSPSDSVAVGPVGPDGTLSSSDLAGILFQAVPAGIPFQVGPVGPCGTLFPSDTVAVGPVGPDGMLSSSDLAEILFPAVPAGIPSPVGLHGMLSPSNSDSVVLVDPGGTLSSSGLVGILVPDGSVELPSLMDPGTTLRTLPLSDSESVDPMSSTGMLSPSVFEYASPGGLVPCDDRTGLFPIVQADEPSSVETVFISG